MGKDQGRPTCSTIGHSTLRVEAFVERLDAHGIERVADVRRYPASRRHPQFNRETLETVLEARGKEYRWFEDLGGRREGVPRDESPNRGIENDGFRHYADYMGTVEFQRAFADLLEWTRGAPAALMCAEAVWWRCHRRLIADRIVAAGGRVEHILDDRRADPHELWDLAVFDGDRLVYPPEQAELGL